MNKKVSSNPTVQSDYEAFERGYNAGAEDMREQIIKLISDYQHPKTQHNFNDEFCNGIIAEIERKTNE
jgi:hypothetical protein